MTLEIVSFRKKKDGGWSRIRVDGMASKNDKGGLDVTLFTIPAASDGMVKLVIQPRQESTTEDDYREKRATGPMSQDDVYGPPPDDVGF